MQNFKVFSEECAEDTAKSIIFAVKGTLMKFSDIPGHEAVKQRLRDMADSDRLPHALLLEGPSGIGKVALARAFAQYIHCQHPTADGEPCGQCPQCIQHQTFNHIDTVYSFPVLKNGRTTAISDDYMEEWKKMLAKQPLGDFGLWQSLLGNPNGQPQMYVEESQAIISKLSFTSHAAAKKIVIMWLPEKMNLQCANKLLKLIEEPLPGVMLVFTSDSPRTILPTIYSRLQRVEVTRYSDSEAAEWLMNSKGIDRPTALAAASLAGGSLLQAEKAAKNAGEETEFFQHFCSLMRLAYMRDVAALKKWSADISGLGREAMVRFLTYCQRMTRENFNLNIHMDALCAMTPDEAGFSSKFSNFITVNNVEQIINQFNTASIDIAANSNAKIVLFDMAVKIIILIRRF